jgi:hypothetical protein
MKFQQKWKLALLGIGLTVAFASWTDEWTTTLLGLKGEIPAPTFEPATCSMWAKSDVEVTSVTVPLDPRAKLNDLEKINLRPSVSRNEVEMCLNADRSPNEIRITAKQPVTMAQVPSINKEEKPTVTVISGNTMSFYDKQGKKTLELPNDASMLSDLLQFSGGLDATKFNAEPLIATSRSEGGIKNESPEMIQFKVANKTKGGYDEYLYNSRTKNLITKTTYDNQGKQSSKLINLFNCSGGGETPAKTIIVKTKKSPYSNNYLKTTTTIHYHSIQSTVK